MWQCVLLSLVLLVEARGYEMLQLLVHRRGPKSTNPNGPCSTVLKVQAGVPVEEVLLLISDRLGFPAESLWTEESGGVQVTSITPEHVASGTLLHVSEAVTTTTTTATELEQNSEVVHATAMDATECVSCIGRRFLKKKAGYFVPVSCPAGEDRCDIMETEEGVEVVSGKFVASESLKRSVLRFLLDVGDHSEFRRWPCCKDIGMDSENHTDAKEHECSTNGTAPQNGTTSCSMNSIDF